MKSVLILVLISLSLCFPGNWQRRSINENSLDIEQAFKLASSNYAKANGVEVDDLIRLTVYSQVVSGMNYNVTFIDSSSENPKIQEYKIYKSLDNSNDNQFQIDSHEVFEAKGDLISINDPKFSELQNSLFSFLKNTNERLNFISNAYPIENYATNFYVISANTIDGQHQYIVCQDKDSEDYYLFNKLK